MYYFAGRFLDMETDEERVKTVEIPECCYEGQTEDEIYCAGLMALYHERKVNELLWQFEFLSC